MNIQQLLDLTIGSNASDLHLLVGSPPTLRIDGNLAPINGMNVISQSDFESLVFALISPYQKDLFLREWELDLGFDFAGKARFRVNIYKQRGALAASLRLIPKTIRSIEETGLPPIVSKLTELEQGLVLVTGPTGHGKSTTLAALINQINKTRSVHILTIEDPIEFVYPEGKALISQRELNSDTKAWNNALKSALREDPDVVLIGEMRDYETIASAMTIAETGHLVLATLHTNSASQSIDRIIDVFPENQQPQIRSQLAEVIEAIISQRLIPTINPGRVLAAELLFAVPALRAIIREGKNHLIDNLIQTSAEAGMIGLETSLATLVREGLITSEVALNYALKPQLLNKFLGTDTTSSA
ncbi:type IV pilus twitching motility protein PilT [Candidatus Daviesbacteria bacterium]|nr:type IV pilus twitching motility protein PilT [Candidatus Daviesbacteria bacterium]